MSEESNYWDKPIAKEKMQKLLIFAANYLNEEYGSFWWYPLLDDIEGPAMAIMWLEIFKEMVEKKKTDEIK